MIYGGPGKDRGQNSGTGSESRTNVAFDNGSGGGPGNDLIYLGPGDDGTYPGGEAFEDVRACPSGHRVARCEFEGGPGNDTMYGGEGNDEMNGDSLISDGVFDRSDPRGGNDTIHGDDGKDLIFGNAGADKIYGDGGKDELDGQDGANTLHGGPANDFLITDHYTGSEVWYGDSGDDRLFRHCTFAGGDCSIAGGAASDTFYGGDGDDLFVTEAEAQGDVYYGSDGDDTFHLQSPIEGSGEHRVYCGRGYDTVEYRGPIRQDLVTRDCEEVTRFGTR